MDKIYQLWDLSTGNVVGDFDTIEEVLAELSDEAKEHGIEAVRDYGLLEFLGDKSSVYAQPDDLVNLVTEHMHSLRR
jgi:hypothetical protein